MPGTPNDLDGGNIDKTRSSDWGKNESCKFGDFCQYSHSLRSINCKHDDEIASLKMKIQALENEMSGLKSEMKKCYEFSNLHPVTDEISLNEGTALVATEPESTSQIVISPIRQLDGLDDTECSECIDRFVGVVEDVDTCGFCSVRRTLQRWVNI